MVRGTFARATLLSMLVAVIACQKDGPSPVAIDPESQEMHFTPEADREDGNDDGGFINWLLAASCKKATTDQLKTVNSGNAKLDKFMTKCLVQTNNSHWCQQLTRPNPDSSSIFSCTYGKNQVHQLIHPDESTWKNAITAVQLVQKLEAMGIGVQVIYNWWRPEPYNKNVGGAAGRHPYGTSIDVRMETMRDVDAAFLQLCAWRKLGLVRAVGYYGSTALHFGIGDKVGNTWGRECPK